MLKLLWNTLLVCTFARVVLCENTTADGFNVFKPARCVQTETGVACNETVSYKDEIISLWPQGSYYLPTPNTGCPETADHGWREGFIAFVWDKPHPVYMKHTATNDTYSSIVSDTVFDEVSSIDEPGFPTLAQGPYRPYTFRLNFCHRLHGEIKAIGQWPGGEYSIYAGPQGCPEGFEGYNKTLVFGKAQYWTNEGYLPEFEVKETGDKTELRLAMCSRHGTSDGFKDGATFTQSDSAFIFVKEDTVGCPRLENVTLTEEAVFMNIMSTYNSSSLEHLESFCFYRPNSWYSDNVESQVNYLKASAYVISNSHLLEGYKIVYSPPDESKETSFMIQGINQEIYKISWKLIDLGRTFSLIGLRIHLLKAMGCISSFPQLFDNKLPKCHISGDKWCFLHFCSYFCPFQTNVEDLQFLWLSFSRPMYGRYIALTADMASRETLLLSSKVDVLTDQTYYDDTVSCLSDLGMADGGIMDFQISASSFQDGHPPTSARPFFDGWCAGAYDDRPFIQVDFLVHTLIDGITVLNWQQIVTTQDNTVWDTVVHFGVDILKLLYGNSTDNLLVYNEGLHFDKTRPFDEQQTLILHRKVVTRYVRIEILKPATNELNCLKFEIQGCRVSGVPSLNCRRHGDMFQLVNTPVTTKRPTRLTSSSLLECEDMCKQHGNCSVVVFHNISECHMYRHSWDQIYTFRETNESETWSTKLCFDHQFTSVPTVTKVTGDAMVSGNVLQVTDEAVITSPGYPFFYAGGQTFKWVVNFDSTSYVKLIFTNISLQTYEESEETPYSCNDTILISSDINPSREAARRIDYRFNGPISFIETSSSKIVITFETCLLTSRKRMNGHGFRAIIAKQDLPACFTLDSPTSWELGRKEICCKSSMVLTSMSLLGMPFIGTTETWQITIPNKRIHLVFKEFQITCSGERMSEFSITDLGVRNTYCNLNMPPTDLYSSSDNILVRFYKDMDPEMVTFQEGFKLEYYSEVVSMENLITYQYPRSNVINVALGKPALMSSTYIYQYPAFLGAGKGTDGTTHRDAAFGACFHTEDEYDPWWMVDLQGIYIIDRIVLHNKRENNAGVLARSIEVSVGTELASLKVAKYLLSIYFEKTVDLHNIRGRFVKLTVIRLYQKFHLCEVEVYGILESPISETAKQNFKRPDPVQDTWASWEGWSNLCYCSGEQPRRRMCEESPSNFGGKTCQGSSVDYRPCSPSDNCNVTNVARGKLSYSSSQNFNWSGPHHATDGSYVIGEESCFQTQFEYQPWWVVDLGQVYELEKIITYIRQSGAIRRRQIAMSDERTNLAILVSMISCEWNVAYFRDGQIWYNIREISLIGHRARYVKIQIIGLQNYLNLCEIDVYGQPVNSISKGLPVDGICQTVDGGYGSWSQWSECSEKCGIGKRTRSRSCDSPAPSNGGRPCYGEDTDIENCVGKLNCPVCSEHFRKCYRLFPELTSWNQACFECMKRGMSLVKIRSQMELQFIRYILRKNRYSDKLPMATFESIYVNASYYVHIGLYRYPVSSRVIQDMWMDRTPVTFKAWKSGEPAKGNCVRMNYKSFDDMKTWESEDCDTSLAEYFICEQPIKDRKLIEAEEVISERHGKDWKMIPEQISSEFYMGQANTTRQGYACIPWETLVIPYNDWRLKATRVGANNYCRDPYLEKIGVWCLYYDSYGVIRSDKCSVVYPTVENTKNFDWRYVGKWNKTFSGKTCQRWAASFPHGHNSLDSYFPGETLYSVHNYCRDPWNNGYLWCYTTSQDTRWEPCVIEDNPDDRCESTHNVYFGRLNITYSGKPCLRWDENEHFVSGGLNNEMFQEHSVSTAGSFCRDPLGNGYLWCFVSGNDGSWEPCIFNYTENSPSEDKSDRTFKCGNNKEISEWHICDGKLDCNDSSDETNCLSLFKEHELTASINLAPSSNSYEQENFRQSSYFLCRTSEWISITARCDGVKDCLDASDETNCSLALTETTMCSSDQFRCENGDCIHISQVCNFVDDCVDRSDEYCDHEECSKTEFRCDNGKCISGEKFCDVEQDCEDNSDEMQCEFCQAGKGFHCDTVRCIPIRLVCDQYKDCSDGSDESACQEDQFTSCEQWWEAGYRESGEYVIGGLTVVCDFNSVLNEKKMYTIIRNYDILWWGRTGYLYSRSTLREEDVRLYEVIHRHNYKCVQEITQKCTPSHQSAAAFDDPDNENNFHHCTCITMRIEIETQTVFSYCNSNGTSSVDVNNVIFSYNGSLSLYRKVLLKHWQNYVLQGYQLLAGPAVCEYDYFNEAEVSACEGDVKVIPESIKCLYDVDSVGKALGCRSGSHLQNCEHFECHEGTVKCPGSYCIPLRFVCDGDTQCPGGEDERGCGCDASENEVLILYDTDSSIKLELDVYNFAKQFQTTTNVVRTLSFVATQPLQDFQLDDVILRISDTVIQPTSAINRVQVCEYNMMAKNFVHEIHVQQNKSTGIIYIDDGEENSRKIFKSLFGSNGPENSDLKLYRVIDQATVNAGLEARPNVIDIVVKRWKLLNTVGAEYFPRLCAAHSKVGCSGKYRCKWSKVCLPMDQVCDGERQCVHGDDEQLCDFTCPDNCTCIGNAADCSNVGFNLSRIATLPGSTRMLDLSYNKGLNDILKSSKINMMVLVSLNVSACSIDEVSRFAFLKIRNLVHLDLSNNDLSVIQKGTFSYLRHIRTLRLDGNKRISLIEPGAFESLSRIQHLNFAGAKLTKISANTFSGLTLQTVDFSNNSINEIEDFAFNELSVKSINFEQNEITNFNKEIFTGVSALKSLKTPAFKFCCIRPNYLPEEGCFPPKDEFSSCEDLMRLSALQTMLWLIGLSALLGNALTIVYRVVYDRQRLRLGFGIFVTNLAIADFMMGVYLIIIAIADAAFRKRYIFMDDYWRNSAWCNLAGVLSTISSEASVFFLCLITIDRVLVIKFPFGGKRFDKKKSLICVTAVWILCTFFAVLPIAYESFFKNKFYTKSGVCIALPLTRDRPPGWVYSVAIFVGLNFATFILVAFGQWSIFVEVRKASGGVNNATAGRTNDLKVARNLLLVVLTDFMCWFPIGVMGMMALNGHVISGDVYAWSAVFILPVNSALNPVLYTVSSIIGRKTFNPSTDEQSRSEMTKELGTRFLNFQRVSRHFSVPTKKSTYPSISSALALGRSLDTVTALKITMQIVKCLDVVHAGSLVMGDLDITTVKVSVNKFKLTGNVRMESEPRLSKKSDEEMNDIYNLGKIVRLLLSKCQEKTM